MKSEPLTPDQKITRLKKALDAAGGYDTWEDVQDGLHEKKYQIFDSADGAIITEIIKRPKGNFLNVWIAAGRLPGIMKMVPRMEKMARADGCKQMVAFGRLGWDRVLPKFGWKKIGVVYAKLMSAMPTKPSSNNNQTTTSTTQQQLPGWLNAASENVIANSMNLGAAPGTPGALPTYTAAPLTGAANTDIQGLQNGVGSTAAGYGSAQGATSNFLGYTPQQVSAGQLSNTDLTPYLNPYTQTVINSALPLLDQQRQQANNQSAAQAVQAGAFGGSREGVAEGVNNSQSALNAAQLAAQLQSANFSQAQGAATTDLNRNLTAAQSNQQAGIQGAGVDLGAAQQLGNLTAQGQTANQAGLTGALAGQTQLQQQAQAEINAPIQDALQRQGVLQSAVGAVPYGTTQNTTSNGPGATSNPWLTGLGALGVGSWASLAVLAALVCSGAGLARLLEAARVLAARSDCWR